MTRDATPYAQPRDFTAPANYGAVSDTPVAGWYLIRLGAGQIATAIQIWHGQPREPWTGELMDRSLRWQARTAEGEMLEIDEVWPRCAKRPISEAEFNSRKKRHQWATQAAPNSAYADRRRRYDPLSPETPLPF